MVFYWKYLTGIGVTENKGKPNQKGSGTKRPGNQPGQTNQTNLNQSTTINYS